ncbi:MAG: PAS domain S-box protein [Gemmataceae bacterium]|nr:PAS domain S-box protein [Gemmata sp.]MDW8196878.1 PAS domain S-box protein [Gemmataceae bacterium]
MSVPNPFACCSWLKFVAVVVAAGAATLCVFTLPPGVAGPIVGGMVFAAAAIVGGLRRTTPLCRSTLPAPTEPAAVSDSLPTSSEARLRLLESAVVHANDAVAILEAAAAESIGRRVVFVNDAFCQLTGYSREEIVGRSLHLLRGPESNPETLNKLRAAMDAGQPLRVELRNYRKDGRPVWVDLSAIPVTGSNGQITHWLMIQRDIDRRKAAERRARQTGLLLRAIIDAFPGPISAKDRDGRYLVMNQFQADLWGISPEHAVGRTDAELTMPELAAFTAQRDRHVLNNGQPTQYELTYPFRDPNGQPWLITKAPFWIPDGIDSEPAGPRGVVTVAHDISALKQTQQALRRSEERYRQLFNAIPHPVFVIDAVTRRIQSVNEAAVRKYGYSHEEFRERSMADILVPIEARSPSDSGTLGLPVATQRHRTRSGTEIEVEVSSFTFHLEGQAVQLALINDVTERRKAEAELKRSEELFRGIFENTSAGVSLTDAEGRFMSCNPAFAAMVGRSMEELLRLTPAAITHPDDYPGQLALMDEVLAGHRDRFTYPKRYIRPDGETVWVELSFAAIRNAAGQYEYGLGVSVNVTERRLLEEQLRQAQKMEAVGQMAGGVAHDFNNLLTAVLGNLSLVRLPDDDPNRPLLAAVEQAATRAADLTRKLLGYARRNQLVFAPVEPWDALNEVASLLRRTVDPRIQLVVQVAPNCPAVHADPTLLAQALMNLCLNSRDAMPQGGTLTLAAEPIELRADDPLPAGWDDLSPGTYVRFTVADTGEGMSEAVLTRIFEPFFTTKGIGKGTGLGLPMVHGIVKQHHGWITVHSRVGEGTRIDLHLPVVESTITPLETDLLTRTPLGPSDSNHGLRAAPTHTILLVDDESMIRDLGRAVLTRAGFQVLTAEDGQEAVELYAQHRDTIELVVLDVTMPRMSGRDAFRHIVEMNPHARILFSTGYTQDELEEVDSAVGLLSKPYRPQELLSAVRAALTITPQPAA